MPDFIKINQTFAEILRLNGSCQLKILVVLAAQAVKRHILHHFVNFREDQSNGC